METPYEKLSRKLVSAVRQIHGPTADMLQVAFAQREKTSTANYPSDILDTLNNLVDVTEKQRMDTFVRVKAAKQGVAWEIGQESYVERLENEIDMKLGLESELKPDKRQVISALDRVIDSYKSITVEEEEQQAAELEADKRSTTGFGASAGGSGSS